MPDPVTGVIAGTAVIGAGASLLGGKQSADAAKDAAKQQRKATEATIKAQKQALERQIGLQEPFRQTGVNALADYGTASQYTPFGMPQFEADPGYNFRMAEGLKGLERSAAARGLLQSGGTLKGIQQYGQNLASSEYENAFSRYLSQREARLDPYRYLSSQGQAAAAGQAANVGSTGAALAEIAAQRGNVNAAQAAGTAGAIGNAFSSIGQGVGSYYANQPYMNYLSSITPTYNTSQ